MAGETRFMTQETCPLCMGWVRYIDEATAAPFATYDHYNDTWRKVAKVAHTTCLRDAMSEDDWVAMNANRETWRNEIDPFGW